MLSTRKAPQGGFTLIELVVVIVILGILAAFAIPRFANIARDARVSALNGMAGSLRSTSALVHGMALARNVADAPATPAAPTDPNISLEGTGIHIVNSYPAAAADGIVAAIINLDPNTYDVAYTTGAGATATIKIKGATDPDTCSVVYTEPASAGAAAVVATPVTTGC